MIKVEKLISKYRVFTKILHKRINWNHTDEELLRTRYFAQDYYLLLSTRRETFQNQSKEDEKTERTQLIFNRLF